MKVSNATLDAAANDWLHAMQTALAQASRQRLVTAAEKVDLERIARSHHARMTTLAHDLHKAQKRGRERIRYEAARAAKGLPPD